jgi:serine protease Do
MKTLKTTAASLALASLLGWPLTVHASTSLDLAKQLNQAFIEVAEKVSPCVVVIDVTQKAAVPAFDAEDSPWNALPPALRRQFRHHFESPLPEKTHGQGSGVIIRKDGYILTNRHVVEDAERIEVRLKDGRRFAATVRGQDLQSDVAVLKIDATDLPAATLADSRQTRVGEFAIAIGAPFNLDYSVTFGHVSAKGRHAIPGEEGATMDQDFIQTDANINPGNSGGPLVNIDGQVIGINTIIRGLRTGIGFAIPSNLAREIADKLIAEGKFTRAWLGIEIRSVNDFEEFRQLVGGADHGVVVRLIDPNGPAAKSDLKPSDVITAVDGVNVNTAQELKNEIRRKQIGQAVTLDVIRKGKPTTVKVKTEEWASASTPEIRPVVARQADVNSVGLTVEPLTHELADQFDTPMTRGVIVTAVENGSLADRIKIQPGEIITEVDQRPVTTKREFAAALQAADLKRGVMLNLINGKTSRFEILRDGED